jgi:hypothetical protein
VARAIWVDNVQDAVKRTSMLELALREHGYKVTQTAFTALLRKNNAQQLAEDLKLRRVVVAALPPSGGSGLAYGIMQLDDKYAFYISNLKYKPEGIPEFRVIIETADEFDSWLAGFVHLSKSPTIPMFDPRRSGV